MDQVKKEILEKAIDSKKLVAINISNTIVHNILETHPSVVKLRKDFNIPDNVWEIVSFDILASHLVSLYMLDSTKEEIEELARKLNLPREFVRTVNVDKAGKA